MNAHNFLQAFERMRTNNLGKQFERRELGILASRNGIYFNSTMWASGLGGLFLKAKVGPRFVYIFKNKPTTVQEVETLLRNMHSYRNNNERKIAHAKAILKRFGINKID